MTKDHTVSQDDSGSGKEGLSPSVALPDARDAKSNVEGSGKVRNRPTPEGRELGKMLARFCDDAEPAARLRMPELPPRCNSCAFRAGPHTANGSPETQMDALKCVMQGNEFMCHEPAREGLLCSGWAMMMLAKESPDFTDVAWPFSDELSAGRMCAEGTPSTGGEHD